MFGRPLEEEHVAYWGARAIMENRSFSLLGDRQSSEGFNPRFKDWLDKRALPWMRNEVKRTKLAQDSLKVLSWDEGNYRIEACPNASFGYLYIGAIQKKEDFGTEPFEKIQEFEVCGDCGHMQEEGEEFIATHKLVRRPVGPSRQVCPRCARRIRIAEQNRVRAQRRKLSRFPN